LSTYVLNIKHVELTSDEAELNQILHMAEAQSYRDYISRHLQYQIRSLKELCEDKTGNVHI